MSKLIIDSEKPITFREYLDICMVGELALKNEVSKTFNDFFKSFPELTLNSFQVRCYWTGLHNAFGCLFKIYEKNKNKNYDTIFAGELNYDNNIFPSFRKAYLSDDLELENERKIENFLLASTIINLLKRLAIEKKKDISLTKHFKIEEQYFTLQVDEINYANKANNENLDFMQIYPYTNTIYRLDLESQIGEHTIFYYNPIKNIFYYDAFGKKMLPVKHQEKLVALLPSLKLDELPSFALNTIKTKANLLYFSNEFGWSTKKPSLFTKIFHPDMKIGYELDIPEKEHLVSNSSINAYLDEEEENTLENTSQIVGSIKSMLANLLENNAQIDSKLKVKLRNIAFFSSITEEKKEIDPFFKDPAILKYCDLSLIDFTNADIEGMDLSNTNASINLKKVYHKSIKNTNLKNINLIGQDLDGIIADNADLRGTHVFVSTDKASIVDTKFSSSSTFMLGTHILTIEEASNMGLHIENEPTDPIKRTLKL